MTIREVVKRYDDEPVPSCVSDKDYAPWGKVTLNTDPLVIAYRCGYRDLADAIIAEFGDYLVLSRSAALTEALSQLED